MNISIYHSLGGGALIGLAAVLLMLTLGRISGISGITSGLLAEKTGADSLWRVAFIAGLISGPLLYGLLGGSVPEVTLASSVPYLAIGGLLVGFGATLGSGCTSGHGVCGLARISPRSILATVVFLFTAMLTVYLAQLSGVQQ